MEDEEEGINDYVTSFKKVWHDRNGFPHRINGPAVVYSDGEMRWFRHGLRHRDDGPAQVWAEHGIEMWYKDDKLYEPSAHEIMVWKMKKEG